MVAQPSGVSAAPPSLVTSANLLTVHSSRSLMKMLNRTGPWIDPWGTPQVSPHLEYCVRCWAPQYERIITKRIKGLVHLSYEERLRDLGWFSLEKAQRRSYQCLKIPEGRVQIRLSQALFSGAQ